MDEKKKRKAEESEDEEGTGTLKNGAKPVDLPFLFCLF
jgi:hypothetical protein